MIDVYYAELTDTDEFLQKILSKFYDIPDAEILRTEKGKPYLLNNPIYFSVSHSKNRIAAAFSDQEIGFDMEFLGRTGDYQSMIRRFPIAEQIEITDMRTLLLHWTIRESYIKFKGETLAENFNVLSCYGDLLYKNDVPISNVFQSGILGGNHIYSICTEQADKIKTKKL